MFLRIDPKKKKSVFVDVLRTYDHPPIVCLARRRRPLKFCFDPPPLLPNPCPCNYYAYDYDYDDDDNFCPVFLKETGRERERDRKSN